MRARAQHADDAHKNKDNYYYYYYYNMVIAAWALPQERTAWTAAVVAAVLPVAAKCRGLQSRSPLSPPARTCAPPPPLTTKTTNRRPTTHERRLSFKLKLRG